MSRLINKPLDFVVKEYKTNHGKGWGIMAKNLSIKPGSKAFHALKNDATVVTDKARGKAKKLGKVDPHAGKDKGQSKKAGKGKSKGKKK